MLRQVHENKRQVSVVCHNGARAGVFQHVAEDRGVFANPLGPLGTRQQATRQMAGTVEHLICHDTFSRPPTLSIATHCDVGFRPVKLCLRPRCLETFLRASRSGGWELQLDFLAPNTGGNKIYMFSHLKFVLKQLQELWSAQLIVLESKSGPVVKRGSNDHRNALHLPRWWFCIPKKS